MALSLYSLKGLTDAKSKDGAYARPSETYKIHILKVQNSMKSFSNVFIYFNLIMQRFLIFQIYTHLASYLIVIPDPDFRRREEISSSTDCRMCTISIINITRFIIARWPIAPFRVVFIVIIGMFNYRLCRQWKC